MEKTDDVIAAAERLLAAVGAVKAAQDEADPARGLHGLRAWAVQAGLPSKPFYRVPEIAKATGVPQSALYKAVHEGTLKATAPTDGVRGWFVRCEWFDEWMDRGMLR